MDTGKVMRIDAEFAYISLKANSSCESCANKCMCQSDSGPVALKIRNRWQLNAGDEVELEISGGLKIWAAFLIFILPIIMLLAGYYLGFEYTGSEIYGIVGAFTGFIISLLVLKSVNRQVEKKDGVPKKLLCHQDNIDCASVVYVGAPDPRPWKLAFYVRDSSMGKTPGRTPPGTSACTPATQRCIQTDRALRVRGRHPRPAARRPATSPRASCTCQIP